MKRLIGIGFCLMLQAISAYAQERMIPDVNHRALPGINSLGERPMYYTYYYANQQRHDKNKVQVVVETFNDTLGVVNRVTLEIDKTADVAAVAFNDRYTFLTLVDPTRKSRTYMLVDREGEVVKKQSEDNIKEALLPENYPIAYTATPEEFTVVIPASTQTGGFTIKALDDELKEKWAKNFAPKAGTAKVEQMMVQGPMLIVLQKELTGVAPEDKTIYTIQAVEMTSGIPMFYTSLTDSFNSLFYPTFMTTDMGRVNVGGVYYKDGKFGDRNSDGIFYSVIGGGGDIQAQGEIPWDSIAATAKGKEVVSLASGKSIFLPRGIVSLPPEQSVIIAETVIPSINSTTQSSVLKSGDLTMMLIGREGKLEKVSTLKTAPQEITTIKPVTTLADAVGFVNSGNTLVYQGSYAAGANPVPYIVYTDKLKDTTRLFFRSLDSSANNNISSIPITFQSHSKKGEKDTKETTARSGMLLTPRGRVLLYNYRSHDLQLASKSINNQSVAGKKMTAAPQVDPRPAPLSPKREPHPHEVDSNHPYNKKR